MRPGIASIFRRCLRGTPPLFSPVRLTPCRAVRENVMKIVPVIKSGDLERSTLDSSDVHEQGAIAPLRHCNRFCGRVIRQRTLIGEPKR